DRPRRRGRGPCLRDLAGAGRTWCAEWEPQAATTFPRSGSHASYKGASRLTTTTCSVVRERTALERYSKRRFRLFMRSHLRTLIVLALAAALLALVLYNVDLRGVGREIIHARFDWLALSLLTMFANLAIRAWRWQYLLEPLGITSFANAFRATAVGFAATSILPARAGEVIRPYFLARHERMSATAAFATV